MVGQYLVGSGPMVGQYLEGSGPMRGPHSGEKCEGHKALLVISDSPPATAGRTNNKNLELGKHFLYQKLEMENLFCNWVNWTSHFTL